jgi:hypothetical protein
MEGVKDDHHKQRAQPYAGSLCNRGTRQRDSHSWARGQMHNRRGTYALLCARCCSRHGMGCWGWLRVSHPCASTEDFATCQHWRRYCLLPVIDASLYEMFKHFGFNYHQNVSGAIISWLWNKLTKVLDLSTLWQTNAQLKLHMDFSIILCDVENVFFRARKTWSLDD